MPFLVRSRNNGKTFELRVKHRRLAKTSVPLTEIDPRGRSLLSAYWKNGSVRSAATRTTASTPTQWAGREHPCSCHVGGVLLRE
jgi:hypothetical protein